MTARPIPLRHWRSYGDAPLLTAAEALVEPFSAFPSWFMRIECDRCGKVQMVNESHAKFRDRALRDIMARMRRDGCDGLTGAGKHAHCSLDTAEDTAVVRTGSRCGGVLTVAVGSI